MSSGRLFVARQTLGAQGPVNISYNGQYVPPWPGAIHDPNAFIASIERADLYDGGANAPNMRIGLGGHDGRIFMLRLGGTVGTGDEQQMGLFQYHQEDKSLELLAPASSLNFGGVMGIAVKDNRVIMFGTTFQIREYDLVTGTISSYNQNWSSGNLISYGFAYNDDFAVYGTGYRIAMYDFATRSHFQTSLTGAFGWTGVSKYGEDRFILWGGGDAATDQGATQSGTYIWDPITQTRSSGPNGYTINGINGGFINGNVYTFDSPGTSLTQRTTNAYRFDGAWHSLGASNIPILQRRNLEMTNVATDGNNLYTTSGTTQILKFTFDEVYFPLRHARPGDRVSASQPLWIEYEDGTGRSPIDARKSLVNITKPGTLLGLIGRAHDGYVIPA